MKILSKINVAVFISGILILTSGIASAAVYDGKITVVDFDGNPANAGKRDICIQMLPALPSTWACLYNTNFMRPQLSTMLREAYEQKKSCQVYSFNNGFDGYPAIQTVICY